MKAIIETGGKGLSVLGVTIRKVTEGVLEVNVNCNVKYPDVLLGSSYDPHRVHRNAEIIDLHTSFVEDENGETKEPGYTCIRFEHDDEDAETYTISKVSTRYGFYGFFISTEAIDKCVYDENSTVYSWYDKDLLGEDNE